MKITMQQFSDKFRSLVGDTNKDIPNSFIITAINWAFNTLPTVPKLSKAFSKHYTIQLDANDHFRWNLNGDFRCLADVPTLYFYTTTGGDPCRLNLCAKDNRSFYAKNGLVELKQKGVPCEYTLEREDDDLYLVLDRPSDVPILIDYFAYGYPKNVEDFRHPKVDERGEPVLDKEGKPIIEETEIELSAIIETLVLNTMREVFYQEAEDLAFAGAMLDTASNKFIPEAIQMLHKRFGAQGNAVLGETGS